MTRELFSATEQREPTRGSLDDVLGREADERLMRTLDRVDELVRSVRRADADRPLEADVLTLLTESARSADAPFEARWLGERVEAGELTWAEVWASPTTHSGGMWLWSRVVRDLAAGAQAAARDHGGAG